MNVKEGDVFPGFSLIDDAGATVTRESLGGRISVIYFYPKDSSPGCTKEACSFRDDMENFKTAGILVYGVSVDSLLSHTRFKQKYSLNFPLLVDENKTLVSALGIKSLFGTARRVTFVLDGSAKILKIYQKISPNEHSKEILSFVKGLKGRTSD